MVSVIIMVIIVIIYELLLENAINPTPLQGPGGGRDYYLQKGTV